MSDDQWLSGRAERPAPATVDAGGAPTPADPMSADDPLTSADLALASADPVPSGAPTPAEPVASAEEKTAPLVRAVDAVELVTAQAVHTHATSYQMVHALLQDALSATDRPAP